MSDGGKTDETSNGEMGCGQEYRLRCGKLKKEGCIFLMVGQEKGTEKRHIL